MLGGFASGLVVYWITNNIITFVQQYAIMRSHGHTPDLFGNIRSSFAKKPAAAVPATSPARPRRAANDGAAGACLPPPDQGHGREELASVVLSAGQALPHDRHWAVTHAISKFDPAAPGMDPLRQLPARDADACGHGDRGTV